MIFPRYVTGLLAPHLKLTFPLLFVQVVFIPFLTDFQFGHLLFIFGLSWQELAPQPISLLCQPVSLHFYPECSPIYRRPDKCSCSNPGWPVSSKTEDFTSDLRAYQFLLPCSTLPHVHERTISHSFLLYFCATFQYYSLLPYILR